MCLGMLNDSTWNDFVKKLSGVLKGFIVDVFRML